MLQNWLLQCFAAARRADLWYLHCQIQDRVYRVEDIIMKLCWSWSGSWENTCHWRRFCVFPGWPTCTTLTSLHWLNPELRSAKQAGTSLCLLWFHTAHLPVKLETITSVALKLNCQEAWWKELHRVSIPTQTELSVQGLLRTRRPI